MAPIATELAILDLALLSLPLLPLPLLSLFSRCVSCALVVFSPLVLLPLPLCRSAAAAVVVTELIWRSALLLSAARDGARESLLAAPAPPLQPIEYTGRPLLSPRLL